MLKTLGIALLTIGLLIVTHSGFSSIQWRHLVRELYGPDAEASLPLDVLAEVLIGVVLSVGGVLLATSSFKSAQIEVGKRPKPYDDVRAAGTFSAYSDRSLALAMLRGKEGWMEEAVAPVKFIETRRPSVRREAEEETEEDGEGVD